MSIRFASEVLEHLNHCTQNPQWPMEFLNLMQLILNKFWENKSIKVDYQPPTKQTGKDHLNCQDSKNFRLVIPLNSDAGKFTFQICV